MITVIIPTLNEEQTIGQVVKYALRQAEVDEVLVVDDKSLDNTVRIATDMGAAVITSTKLGKGASMKEGVLCARNDILVFLDGDIDPYPPETVPLLSDPILSGDADFVKAAFGRNLGRVTELVAKPLLHIFFPELTRFNQPLSGMVSGRKRMLKEIDFREDYGVDIGLLIDMYLRQARIREVEIGYLENKSKPWQALGKMSREVAQTIILKAAECRNPHFNFEELGVLTEIRSQLDFVMEDQLRKLQKLIIFDLDNTVLKGRFIDSASEKLGFHEALMELRLHETDPVLLTKKIATLFRGTSIHDIWEIIRGIHEVEDAAEVIGTLKRRGYITGIITDGYDIVANHFKNKLGMDFALGHELEFSKGICTGEVKLPSFYFNSSQSPCKHPICKTNAMLELVGKYQIRKENCVAVGDSLNDLCMIKEAGIGVAFCSSDELVNHHADIVISDHVFRKLLDIAI